MKDSVKERFILGADLFCGAGGTSQGYLNACARLQATPRLLAINHWPVAIATHRLNHPGVTHLCDTLDRINPRLVLPNHWLHLLTASPECTHHSNAASGRPRNDQSRATAWHVLRWAEALHIDNILIENVREFLHWGPLTRAGKPVRRLKGQTFKAFLQSLQSLDYRVEYRVLNAADYGDPTTRERLFILARHRRRIDWPAPTHSQFPSQFSLLPPVQMQPWRPAREIIDWSLKGQSIFARKKPLCPNTLKRIAAGLRKFSGPNAEPFLVMLNGTTDGHLNSSAHSLDEPCPTVITSRHAGLVQPFVIGQQSGAAPRSVGDPLPTVAGAGAIAIVEPFITAYHNPHMALVQPIIVKYHGTATAQPVDAPLAAVTTRDHFLLVDPVAGRTIAELDILFRMLQPHELAAAQGFPKDYQFTGTREQQIKQIGNAVPVNLATALCYTLLS